VIDMMSIHTMKKEPLRLRGNITSFNWQKKLFLQKKV
jgi:hypothetical protein